MEREKGGRKGSRRERKERRKGERERKEGRKREERRKEGRKEGGLKKTGRERSHEKSQKKSERKTPTQYINTHIYMEFGKMIMMTLYDRPQKRYRCKEQTFGLSGRRQEWDGLRE